MRDFVEDLVRDRVNGFDVWLHVNGRSGTAFCLAGPRFNVVRVRFRASKVLHQAVESGSGHWSNLVGELALGKRPACECWSATDTVRNPLRFDIRGSQLGQWRWIKEVLARVEQVESPSPDLEVALQRRRRASGA